MMTMMMSMNCSSLSSFCDTRLASNPVLFNHHRLISSRFFYKKCGAFVLTRSRNFRVYCESPKTNEVQIRKVSPILESALQSGNDAVPSNEWKTVPDIWQTSAEKFGDRVALVDPYHNPQMKMTYKQLEQEILNFCEGLRVIGLKPDQKIALFADNSCRWLVSDQGAVNVVRGTRSSVEELLQIYNHSERDKLVNAPYGFDKSTWDPSCDNFLPQSYSADDMTGKSMCKLSLQRHLDLPEGASEIIVGCIYSDALNVDLEKLKILVWMASRRKVQFIFMGSIQSPGTTIPLELFKEEVKEDENVRFIDEYDEELSHLIISGSDIMLCPSFDDPLLQVPLKAIKYGTAPVPVHLTESRFGHFGDDNIDSTKFSQYINSTFADMPLGQAIDKIKNNPSEWNRRIIDGMGKDFSWDSECADVHIEAYSAVKQL